MPTAPVLTLSEAINRVPERRQDGASQESRLRNTAMQDAALSYGARAGLAWESRGIAVAIRKKTAELSRLYDFQRLLIKGPDNIKILPPVISEAKSTWEAQDAGKTLRVADTFYEIIDQARFTAIGPTWQSYLMRDYKIPESPPDALLPKDSNEREQWAAWVTEGWENGRKQAQEIFNSDLERLDRDFHGMVRYRSLLEEGKVSPPQVADARLGTTGTGQDMRVNDRAVRITRDPSLNVAQPVEWRASATTQGADGTTSNPTATGGQTATSQAKSARASDAEQKTGVKSPSANDEATGKRDRRADPRRRSAFESGHGANPATKASDKTAAPQQDDVF